MLKVLSLASCQRSTKLKNQTNGVFLNSVDDKNPNGGIQ